MISLLVCFLFYVVYLYIGCIREQTLFELAEERGVSLSSRLFLHNNNNNNSNSTHDNNSTNNNKDDDNNPPNYSSNSSSNETEIENDANDAKALPQPQPCPHMYNVAPRSLQDCFEMFAEIPKAVNDLPALERITWEALQDFATHHVTYLELRTTPKCLLVRHGQLEPRIADKRTYLQTVLQVMHQFQQQEEGRYQQELNLVHSNINNNHKTQVDPQSTQTEETKTDRHTFLVRLPLICRLIVAVDRGKSLEEATENINLALELAAAGAATNDNNNTTTTDPLSSSLIVGVDLGGNPTKHDFSMFRPLFEKVRQPQQHNGRRLGITLHCAEIPCADKDETKQGNTNPSAMKQNSKNINDTCTTMPPSSSLQRARQEAKEMLEFRPDRLGHALLLPSDLKENLMQHPICVETCPTSNLLTLELAHHPSPSSSSQLDSANNPTTTATKEGGDERKHGLQRGLSFLVQALRQHHPTLSEWMAATACTLRSSSSSSNMPKTKTPTAAASVPGGVDTGASATCDGLGFPLAICTDDPGVFGTNATQELVLLQNAFHLNSHELQFLILQSINHAFCTESTKQLLRQRLTEWQQQQ